MAIHTVMGPIESTELGSTSMHEHLLLDARAWLAPAREELPEEPSVTIDNLGFIRWNFLSLADNLVSDDPEVVVRELSVIGDLGGKGIVDLTVVGLGRRVKDLTEISRRVNLHVMVGCGWYIHQSHPQWLEDATADELASELISELTDGVNGTGIKPALIGEIGTSDPITHREEKVLVAAGRASAATGASVNVHLDPRGTHALPVLDLLKAEGVSPDRVILSHMDSRLDRQYHIAVAERGAILSYDSFGHEFYYHDMFREPSDLERCQSLKYLVDEGFENQLVMGCDAGAKATLTTYGGMGYQHLLKRIVPALRAKFGFTEATIARMLVDTPRRLLDR